MEDIRLRKYYDEDYELVYKVKKISYKNKDKKERKNDIKWIYKISW